jgi:hypothetical protein
MKNQKLISIPLLALGLFAITFSSCKKSTPTAPTSLTLSDLKSGSTDLNGATSATGVDPTADIVATFSTAVDASTATSSNITFVNATEANDASLTYSIAVSGSTITISHSTLGNGNEYSLTFGNGLKASNGQAITTTTRTFTVVGAFAPSGAVAYWNFDGNANDGSGNNEDGTATAITYVSARNSTAGQAAAFNGTTSIFEAPNGDALLNSPAFSISMWTNFDTVGHLDSAGNSYNDYWGMGIGFFNGMEWQIHSNFTMNFQFHITSSSDTFPDGGTVNVYCAFDGTDNTMSGTFPGIVHRANLTQTGGPDALLNNKWANVVFTFDASTGLIFVYINGVIMEEDNLNLWPIVPGYSLEHDVTGLQVDPQATGIGPDFALGFATDRSSTFWQSYSTEFGFYASPYSFHYQGLMDDVRIYHKALTGNEVALMYSSGK